MHIHTKLTSTYAVGGGNYGEIKGVYDPFFLERSCQKQKLLFKSEAPFCTVQSLLWAITGGSLRHKSSRLHFSKPWYAKASTACQRGFLNSTGVKGSLRAQGSEASRSKGGCKTARRRGEQTGQYSTLQLMRSSWGWLSSWPALAKYPPQSLHGSPVGGGIGSVVRGLNHKVFTWLLPPTPAFSHFKKPMLHSVNPFSPWTGKKPGVHAFFWGPTT
jgi:hypothetical protein